MKTPINRSAAFAALRSVFDSITIDRPTAIYSIEQLPPNPDRPDPLIYRYEFAIRLGPPDREDPPEHIEVQSISDTVIDRIEAIEADEWAGADEIRIQIYGPRDTVGAGACGSARWIRASESGDPDRYRIETRPYMFTPPDQD